VQLLNYFANHLRQPQRPLLHFTLAVVRKVYSKALMPLLNKFADLFRHQAIVDAQCPDSIYVGIFVQAQKPTEMAVAAR
jgi:hypothetical protein